MDEKDRLFNHPFKPLSLSVQVSDPLRMRTAAEGALYTTAFRISEYSFDVDFLQNHDGANTLAMPVRDAVDVQ